MTKKAKTKKTKAKKVKYSSVRPPRVFYDEETDRYFIRKKGKRIFIKGDIKGDKERKERLIVQNIINNLVSTKTKTANKPKRRTPEYYPSRVINDGYTLQDLMKSQYFQALNGTSNIGSVSKDTSVSPPKAQSSTLQNVGNVISGVASGVASGVGNAVKGATNVASNLATGTGNLVSAVGSGVGNVASGAGTLVSGTGNLVSGTGNLVSGVGSGVGDVVSGVGNLATGVGNIVRSRATTVNNTNTTTTNNNNPPVASTVDILDPPDPVIVDTRPETQQPEPSPNNTDPAMETGQPAGQPIPEPILVTSENNNQPKDTGAGLGVGDDLKESSNDADANAGNDNIEANSPQDLFRQLQDISTRDGERGLPVFSNTTIKLFTNVFNQSDLSKYLSNRFNLGNQKQLQGNAVLRRYYAFQVFGRDNVLQLLKDAKKFKTKTERKKYVLEQMDKLNPRLGGSRKRSPNDGALYSDQIEQIMKHYIDFTGVIDSDQIHTLPLKRYQGFIMNKAKSHESNDNPKTDLHWVAVLIDCDEDKTIEYYDSFAEDPSPAMSFEKQIKTLVDKMGVDYYLKFKINRVKEQREDSALCGYHAIRFLKKRFNGVPFKDCTGFSDVKRQERNAKQMRQKFEKFGYV